MKPEKILVVQLVARTTQRWDRKDGGFQDSKHIRTPYVSYSMSTSPFPIGADMPERLLALLVNFAPAPRIRL